MTKSSLFALLSVFLGSCTTYHYVTPLPAVPQFQKAGDVQVQTALSVNHGEIQVSASPLKHFGLSYNGFRSFHSASRMHSVTLHGYLKMGHTPLFLTGSLGYDNGFMESKREKMPSSMNYEDHFLSSRYQTYRVGAGIYAHFRGDEHRQVSFDVHYQHILFSELSTLHETYSGWRSWEAINLVKPSTYAVVSPLLTLTLIGSRKGLFYYRQTLGANIALGKRLLAERTHWDQPPNAPKIYTYTNPVMSAFVFSGAVGMRLNVLDQFFRKKSPN